MERARRSIVALAVLALLPTSAIVLGQEAVLTDRPIPGQVNLSKYDRPDWVGLTPRARYLTRILVSRLPDLRIVVTSAYRGADHECERNKPKPGPHSTGQVVDIRPIRLANDGLPVKWYDPEYDIAATQWMVDRIRAIDPNVRILFNDPCIQGVSPLPGDGGLHDNHLHVHWDSQTGTKRKSQLVETRGNDASSLASDFRDATVRVLGVPVGGQLSYEAGSSVHGREAEAFVRSSAAFTLGSTHELFALEGSVYGSPEGGSCRAFASVRGTTILDRTERIDVDRSAGLPLDVSRTATLFRKSWTIPIWILQVEVGVEAGVQANAGIGLSASANLLPRAQASGYAGGWGFVRGNAGVGLSLWVAKVSGGVEVSVAILNTRLEVAFDAGVREERVRTGETARGMGLSAYVGLALQAVKADVKGYLRFTVKFLFWEKSWTERFNLFSWDSGLENWRLLDFAWRSEALESLIRELLRSGGKSGGGGRIDAR